MILMDCLVLADLATQVFCLSWLSLMHSPRSTIRYSIKRQTCRGVNRESGQALTSQFVQEAHRRCNELFPFRNSCSRAALWSMHWSKPTPLLLCWWTPEKASFGSGSHPRHVPNTSEARPLRAHQRHCLARLWHCSCFMPTWSRSQHLAVFSRLWLPRGI